MIFSSGGDQYPDAASAVLATAPIAAPGAVGDLFSPGDVLRQRLRTGAQLLTVLAEQTEAFERGEGERADRLNVRRQRLEREIAHASMGPVQGEPHTDAASQINRLLDQALALLEERSEAEQRLRDWMDVVQGASLARLCGESVQVGTNGAHKSGDSASGTA